MDTLLAVIGTIAVGVAVRFIYDFWVKPLFSKDKIAKDPIRGRGATAPPSKADAKTLKKAAKAEKKASKK